MQYKYGKYLYLKTIHNYCLIRTTINLNFNASLVKWQGKSRDNLPGICTGRNHLWEITFKSQWQKIKWERPRNNLRLRYKRPTMEGNIYKIILKDRKRIVKQKKKKTKINHTIIYQYLIKNIFEGNIKHNKSICLWIM